MLARSSAVHLAVFVMATIVDSRGEGHEGHGSGFPAFGPVMTRLSSDGSKLAFSYQGSIWTTATQNGPMIRLTSDGGYDIEPAWSPDGSLVAFIRTRNFQSGELTVVRTATGRAVTLPQAATVMDKLYFDLQGQRILGVFQREPGPRIAWYDMRTGELSDAVPAGSWPGTPFATSGLMRQRFALSNDQQSLAVVTTDDAVGEQQGNRGPRNEIWQVPLAGGNPSKILGWPARIFDLCWQADDQGLVFVTERGGAHLDLWEIPIDDAEPQARKLTFGQADEFAPSISGDRTKLAYIDNRHGPTQIVVRDLKNSTERILVPSGIEFGQPTGQLHLKLRQAGGSENTIARVVIRHEDGKYNAPPGSLYRIAASEMHFYAENEAQLTLPIGKYVVKVFHGPEFLPVRVEADLKSDQTSTLLLELPRWTNQRAEGWVGGESHIHANYGYGAWYNSPATMRLQCSGEDLTVANLVVANSNSDGVFDREFFLGRPDPLSSKSTVLYWNEEFRSTIWGHLTLLNLKYLVSPIFTGFQHTTHPHDVPTNADIADHTHDQDGHVNYTHPAHSLQDPYATAYSAKEMPVDVALGKIDSIDVMGTGHQANLPLWYRMLNCGLKIPASAGTDCFLNRIVSNLPGGDRVYVNCPGEFSYQTWIDNLRRGRTFVTNGPMLRFTVNEAIAGSEIQLAAPGKVRVRGQAHFRAPLKKLEVLVNGKVQAQQENSNDSNKLEIDESLEITRSGWIAIRVQGAAAQDQISSEAFAHTSPVYVQVAGKPARSSEDAEYFIAWIERLWRDVRARNRIPAGKQVHVESQIADALAFYRRLAAME